MDDNYDNHYWGYNRNLENTQTKSFSHKSNYLGKDIEIKRTKQIGKSRDWDDEIQFDDFKKFEDLLDFKISKIKIWYGNSFSPNPPVVNGIQVFYKNLLTNEEISTPEYFGPLNLQGSQEFELNDNEYIVDCDIRAGWIMDKVTFLLNSGREFSIGGSGGSGLKFNLKGYAAVGIHGSYGSKQALYNLGFYVTDLSTYQSNLHAGKRQTYLRIRKAFKNERSKEMREKILDLYSRERKQNESYYCILKLVDEKKFCFMNVLKYLC